MLARVPGVELSTALGAAWSCDVAFSGPTLCLRTNRSQLRRMRRWRSTMRGLSAEARLHLHARSYGASGKAFHAAALYGALALIAAVVFGTLSVHPF